LDEEDQLCLKTYLDRNVEMLSPLEAYFEGLLQQADKAFLKALFGQNLRAALCRHFETVLEADLGWQLLWNIVMMTIGRIIFGTCEALL